MPAIAPATIAELARKSGIDGPSIRLYEKLGFLPRHRRRRGRGDDAAHHQEHCDRLMLIERALALGFSFDAIADLATDCPRKGPRSDGTLLAELSRPAGC